MLINFTRRIVICILIVLLGTQSTSAERLGGGKLISGWLESIFLLPWGIKMRAKFDTGAKTSSIHAEDIEEFERDGEHWVRFETHDFQDDNENKRLISIERPLVRTVKIRRHNLPEKKRYVVRLAFCFNKRIFESEFTLAGRSKFHYPVLLGRRLLERSFLVDPSSTFTIKTNPKHCALPAKQMVEILREEPDPGNVH